MDSKVEIWNGYEIRFVEKDLGEWWAVAKDVSESLDYRMASDMTRIIDDSDKGTHKVRTTSDKAKCPKTQDMTIISEFGIYDAIWGSRKPEAKDFRRWVKKTLAELRKASGLEGFQVFRMLDKDHQKAAMARLQEGLGEATRRDYIKANTIADKAVSTRYGHPKMVKKNQMTPEMLVDRQSILSDTINLIVMDRRFDLGLSVSKEVYGKYAVTQ